MRPLAFRTRFAQKWGDIKLDDLPHLTKLPPHVVGELLTLKKRVLHCERMLDRHDYRTRRGHPWYRKARRLDKRYRRLWERHPAPTQLSDPIPLGDLQDQSLPSGAKIKNATLFMETVVVPQSGHRRRLPRKWTLEAPTEYGPSILAGIDLAAGPDYTSYVRGERGL